MGLLAQFDPLAVRRLVLLEFRAVIKLVARCCTKIFANDETKPAHKCPQRNDAALHAAAEGAGNVLR